MKQDERKAGSEILYLSQKNDFKRRKTNEVV
jgi:hypothetical protein